MTDRRPDLVALERRLARTEDEQREEARGRRHARGYRTARENLADLVDAGSFQEYGQLATAAQRSRRDREDLQRNTPADGIITGVGTINAAELGAGVCRTAVAINDYTVLAGTQGYFHHRKLDRLMALARRGRLPCVMYTEGGGGRPGDTDVTTQIAGLNLETFRAWAALRGVAPRIAVNNGYCFAGNAALFGCSDLTIATRSSWIGMAGPAMIEGGGLGTVEPGEIGPAAEQASAGVVDIVADDEAHATLLARQALGYFQGSRGSFEAADQRQLRGALPEDRRFAYPVRRIIDVIGDTGSVLEIGSAWGRSIMTALVRIEGRAVGVLANDCQSLGGAIDAAGADKASSFLRLCQRYGLPVVAVVDTPGFMVGVASERQGAVRRMAELFLAGAEFTGPLVAVFLRKAYGLGAMAMTGGSFAAPRYAVAWPSGEFGAMGLEGAVRLGFRKELEAESDPERRAARFDELLGQLYESGRATETAAHLEIDAVIDPAATRVTIARALD